MGAAVVAVIAAHVARAEREFAEHFRRAGATAPDCSVPLPEVDRAIGRRQLERWMRDGVLRAGPGGYWLDEAAYEARQQHQTKGGVAVLITLLFVLLVVGLGLLLASRRAVLE